MITYNSIIETLKEDKKIYLSWSATEPIVTSFQGMQVVSIIVSGTKDKGAILISKMYYNYLQVVFINKNGLIIDVKVFILLEQLVKTIDEMVEKSFDWNQEQYVSNVLKEIASL